VPPSFQPSQPSPVFAPPAVRSFPIVGDVRGTGFFYAIELVKDKETR
jgi:adenosylmethionine-8-amino-7-oxononanoate aminotransferase